MASLFTLHPYTSPLYFPPSLAAEDAELAPSPSPVSSHQSLAAAHRAIPHCCLQTGKRRCVTQLAPTKDKVITAPIVPIYICWYEEIIDLSELEQGMLENYGSESHLCQEISVICCSKKGIFL